MTISRVTNAELESLKTSAMMAQVADFDRGKLISVEPATLESILVELLAVREAQSVPAAGTCEQEVYEHGKSACMVDIPKHMAEEICRSLSLATGFRIDWHYFGGRVHIKVLAPPAPAVPTDEQLIAFAERHRLKLDNAWLLQIWEDAISLAAAPTPTKAGE